MRRIGSRLTAPPRLLQPLSLDLLSGRDSFPIPPLPLLPRPRPLPPPRSDLSDRSRSRTWSSRILRSRSASARESPSVARRISSFFSSTKLRGMPAGESCASISKLQRASMNAGVESVRKPVRLICIFLGSGVCARRQYGCKCGKISREINSPAGTSPRGGPWRTRQELRPRNRRARRLFWRPKVE
jgi:hypothetical protein